MSGLLDGLDSRLTSSETPQAKEEKSPSSFKDGCSIFVRLNRTCGQTATWRPDFQRLICDKHYQELLP